MIGLRPKISERGANRRGPIPNPTKVKQRKWKGQPMNKRAEVLSFDERTKDEDGDCEMDDIDACVQSVRLVLHVHPMRYKEEKERREWERESEGKKRGKMISFEEDFENDEDLNVSDSHNERTPHGDNEACEGNDYSPEPVRAKEAGSRKEGHDALREQSARRRLTIEYRNSNS